MVLDFAHRGLSVKREFDEGKVIHLVSSLGEGLTGILGLARQSECLGQAERRTGANLANGLLLPIKGRLLSSQSLRRYF